MATALCKVPCFLSLSSHKLFFLNHHHHHHHHLQLQPQSRRLCENPPRKNSHICACSANRPRGGRKVKSNEQLCDDIRDFVSSVGLPHGHVPSIKELYDHGRTDLANMVRRRGYKAIEGLKSNQTKAEERFAKLQHTTHDTTDMPAGQDMKVEFIVEDRSLSSEIPVNNDHSACMTNDSEYAKDWQDEVVSGMAEGKSFLTSSCKLKEQDQQANHILEDGRFSTSSCNVEKLDGKVLLADDPLIARFPVEAELQDGEPECIAEEDSLSITLYNAEKQMEEVSSVVKDKSLSAEVSTADNNFDSRGTQLNLYSEGDASVPVKASPSYSMEERDLQNSEDISKSSSLEEKVAKFIQHGDLDAVEDNVYRMVNETDTEEINGISGTNTPLERNSDRTVSRSNAGLMVNGSLQSAAQVSSPVAFKPPIRDDQFAAESLVSANLDEDLNAETKSTENQVEISNLKFMLHQKELELSHLKDLIEKEKLALSTLQMKAEAEITKAQELISQKEAEAIAAEESLSGLVEVKLQFSGDGEIVEVTGSFNGWHHRIQMDLQPSSVNVDPFGPRKPRIWSTVLWLYPGVYEIKFIVDGQWIVDPKRKSVTRGGICNNILRVSR
ncbi:hypothetical protein Tsubulata_030288 [Turnera subulata]|uniref:AMP-activated protein kinase glycogen-binding domain-containing protein n=1 Tax=Turnera subulata TaxID=218843 RepID=A0A9Q0JH77_9ROSI|nr:hypothetical protein Tsubulata_030288 [Turnera subulata]